MLSALASGQPAASDLTLAPLCPLDCSKPRACCPAIEAARAQLLPGPLLQPASAADQAYVPAERRQVTQQAVR